jgi:TonB-linked SusC/RagA family outer membrane protein
MNDNSRSDNYTRTTFPHSIGIASISFYEDLHLDWDNIITYTKTIANDHNITIMGGINYEKDISKNVGVSGSGFLSNVFGTYNIGAAANLNTPSSSYGEWTMLSYVDGSSRYSSGNKWGNFLSGAFAWRISEEAFMKNISQISDLKLRIGYGEVGNTAINPYYTLDILSSDKTAFGNALYSYFSPGTRLPASLKWETTAQSNIGLDVGILGGRFRLTVDYYIKNTRDLLNTVQLPSSLGYTTTVKNVGKMRNSGLELYLNANIFNSGFSWDVSPNISFNRNKVLKLSGGQDLPGSTMSLTVVNDYLNLLREGHPISAFYGYQVSGWDKNGQFTYNDNNNDGLISALDKTFIGDPNPDFIYGLNSNMSWKNFSLNIFIQGTQGNDLYSFSEICFNYKWNNGYNGFKELLYNHWTPDNTNAKYPAITSLVAARMSDYFVYNGSYLRLKNIELAYNIPADKLHINWIKMGQVYVSGQNLLTISKYPWWDPEVNSYGSATSVNQGIDYYSYPTSKGITLGVRFTF